MMRRSVFQALSECVVMTDKPFLQIEAVRTLVAEFDTGLTTEQREKVDFLGVLFELCDSSDDAVSEKSGVLLGEIANSTSEALRNFFWEPLVRGVMGIDGQIEADQVEDGLIEADQIEADQIEADQIEADQIEADQIEADQIEADQIEADQIEAQIEADQITADRIKANQIKATKRFELLLRSIRNDPPVQRVIDSGLVPHIVEFLWRNEDELQLPAVRTLTCIIETGNAEHTGAVIGAGAIPALVRLLHSSYFLRSDEDHRPTLQLAVRALTCIIEAGNAEHTGMVIGAGAIPHFVRLLHSSPLDDVKEKVAKALAIFAGQSLISRDDVLRNGAMPSLLIQAERTLEGSSLMKFAALAICRLCAGDPSPPLKLVRAALPTLAKLLRSEDDEVFLHACLTWAFVSGWPYDEIRVFATNEAFCRRVVELLKDGRSNVQ
jgi:Armadillo/beta-catenin-like repeat